MLSRDKLRKVAVAGMTFTFALAIGFVMQNGDALAARLSDQPAVAAATLQSPQLVAAVMVPQDPVAAAGVSVPVAVALEPAAVRTAAVTTLPTMPPETPAPVLLAALDIEPEVMEPPPPSTAATNDCPVAVMATTLPAGLVRLDLAAPCLPDRVATIHHQGMMFTLLTAADGTASATVPALVQVAVFVVDLGEGQGAVAVAEVPEVALIDRAVLQWQGTDGLGIHAREFGAAYGSSAHVWAGNPRAADAAMLGQGGFLIRLGDPSLTGAMLAEVYTFPTGTSVAEGQVDLSVEASVTAANCGQEIAAQAIQISPEGSPSVIDLTMIMPDCDALGELLVLSNMLMDLTLAAR